MSTPLSLGTPQHSESQVIKLSDRRNNLRLKKAHGMLGQKLGAVVGPTYAFSKPLSELALLFGGVYGLLTAKQPVIKRTTLRLKMNYYLNTLGRGATRCANSAAALTFLYLVVAKSSNYIFAEELQHLGEYSRAAIFGAFTGAMYRVTFPYQAVLLSSLLGAGVACGYTFMWNQYFKYDKLTE